MKQKLLDIKLILRIIISVLVIFSMLKSCAKAKTTVPQDILDEINVNIEKVANYYGITNSITYIPSYIEKENTNSYCIFITESNSGWQPNTIGAFFPQYDTLSPTYNGSQYLNNIGMTIRNVNNGTYIGCSDWSVLKSAKFKYIYTQFNWATTTGFSYQANNEYGAEIIFAPDVNIYFGNMFSTTITYNSEEIQANTLDYNYRIEFIDNVVTEDNEITSIQATLGTLNLECQDLGSYWTLKCNNSTQLQYNQVYDLIVTAIVNGNEEEIEEKMIFVPPGTTISGGIITNIPSGDYNFNLENSTNQIIGNQDQIQENNQSFFENLYNNLFTISSGEVSGEVNKLIASLNLETSGEQQIVSMIYEEFNKEPTDFIISWQPATITIEGKTLQIIPSGEINFSEKCREEPSLARVKGIVNVITSAYLLIVLLIANQDMILRLLGTENRFLDEDKDELIVDVQGIAYEQLPYTTNLPTYSGTDPNYWWYRARKRF